MKNKRLYNIWKRMRCRCNNKNFGQYKDYGGRGIKVCSEWDSYLNFERWSLESGYKENLSIDRIDNDQGYRPDNCRWATRKQQNNNQRSNILLSYQGKTQTAAMWADQLGIKRSTIYHRIERGWNDIEVLSTPYRKRLAPAHNIKFYEYKGKKLILKELSNLYGVKPGTISYRLNKGWDIENAVKPKQTI